METKRDYMWDNMKGILIFLVVAGHFLESNTLSLGLAKDFDYWIYTFHMPAFIFISGFWTKKYCRQGKVRGEKTAVLIAYYLLFQLLLTCFSRLIEAKVDYSLFSSRRGLWYIFSLILYYLLVPVIEKIPPYITIPGFIILGVLISNDLSAGTYFSIHRTFVFAPFFFAGYYLTGESVKKLQGIKSYIRYPLGAALFACSVAIWKLQSEDVLPRRLFYGKANFFELDMRVRNGAVVRLEAYLIAALMIVAMILLVPKCKTFLSYLGRKSLQIYIFHLPLIIALFDTDFLNLINIDTYSSFFLLLLAAAGVTGVLSIGIFTYPFKWIQMLVDKIYSLGDKGLKH